MIDPKTRYTSVIVSLTQGLAQFLGGRSMIRCNALSMMCCHTESVRHTSDINLL